MSLGLQCDLSANEKPIDERGEMSIAIRPVLIVALACLSSILPVGPVQAGAPEDVAAATLKWVTTFAEGNADRMAALYARDAVLWGTTSPSIRADPAAVKNYFTRAFAVISEPKVSLVEQHIRVYGDTAINTGLYSVSFVRKGAPVAGPARFSFTYVKRGGEWMIVDHHSSAVPAPPQAPARQ